MKPAIVIIGDCQAMVLAQGLQRLPQVAERFDIVFQWTKKLQEDPPQLVADEVWRRCASFWLQIGDRVVPEDRFANAPRDRITFSALYLPITFPFQSGDGVIQPGPIYSDPFLINLSEGNLTGDAIYAEYERMQQAHLASIDPVSVDRILEATFRLMAPRDVEATVKITGWAMARTCERRLMWTSTHPAEEMSTEQLDRLLRAAFPEDVKPGRPFYRAGTYAFCYPHDLHSLQDPVSRTVAEHLGLAWWRAGHRYRVAHMGAAMTLREFVIWHVTQRRKLLHQPKPERALAQ